MTNAARAEKVFYLHDPGGNTAAHIYTYTRVNAVDDRVGSTAAAKSSCTTVLEPFRSARSALPRAAISCFTLRITATAASIPAKRS